MKYGVALPMGDKFQRVLVFLYMSRTKNLDKILRNLAFRWKKRLLNRPIARALVSDENGVDSSVFKRAIRT